MKLQFKQHANFKLMFTTFDRRSAHTLKTVKCQKLTITDFWLTAVGW